jgi:hypothetical protein
MCCVLENNSFLFVYLPTTTVPSQQITRHW